MGLVTVLSLVSFSNSDIPKVGIPNLDKAVHFTFYFVATILGCLLARERTGGQIRISKAILIFAAVTVIYGIIIEVLQHRFTATRDGSVYDALANITGTLIGVGVIFFLFSSKGRLKWKF